MVDKTVIQQKFEQLPPATQQNITSSAAELARDARFQQFSDSLVQAYKPTVDRWRSRSRRGRCWRRVTRGGERWL